MLVRIFFVRGAIGTEKSPVGAHDALSYRYLVLYNMAKPMGLQIPNNQVVKCTYHMCEWIAKIKRVLDFLFKGAMRVGLLRSCSVCRVPRQHPAACDLEFMATVKSFTMAVILALGSTWDKLYDESRQAVARERLLHDHGNYTTDIGRCDIVS